MSNVITTLHPRLQAKIDGLIYLCEKQGIKIRTTECLRSVKEQDDLYAKGRTKQGKIVTNAKGSSYSSMHQWGVAFDFVINMDANKNGKVDIADCYNATLMNKVGRIGQSIGLEWGGAWKSLVDKPHFQLKDWGSSPNKLKRKYSEPKAFMNTWKNVSGKYQTKKEVALRVYCGKEYKPIVKIPKGATVNATRLYDKSSGGFTWYQVRYKDGKYRYIGYVPKSALKKVK